MRKSEAFVFGVQTLALVEALLRAGHEHGRSLSTNALRAVVAAAELPEEALAIGNVYNAANEFFQWMTNGGDAASAPTWVAEGLDPEKRSPAWEAWADAYVRG